MFTALFALSAHAAHPTYAQLLRRLDAVAASVHDDPDVRAHWSRLVARHQLADTESAYREFVRVRLVHEATRAGGHLGLVWNITDRPPDATHIWAAWRAEPSAPVVAECDELSALFAQLGRGLGVANLGLFWPTSNHTVAVWTTPGADGTPVRIVVPTSQIFLAEDAGLGDTTFDAWSQRTIYNYGGRELKPTDPLPAALVDRMVEGAQRFAGAPEAELLRRRLTGDWSVR